MKRLNDVLCAAAKTLEAAENELCAIDAETGDGDHGVTVAKIARALIDAAESGPTNVFSEASIAVMKLNGGSAGPLWAMLLDGMGEAYDGLEIMDAEGVRKLLAGALDALGTVSDARVGDKTMMDALIPAAQAAKNTEGGVQAVLDAVADAAERGAEATKDMVAKYGRAKNLHADSLGHRDAGAVGLAVFARAVADANLA